MMLQWNIDNHFPFARLMINHQGKISLIDDEHLYIDISKDKSHSYLFCQSLYHICFCDYSHKVINFINYRDSTYSISCHYFSSWLEVSGFLTDMIRLMMLTLSQCGLIWREMVSFWKIY